MSASRRGGNQNIWIYWQGIAVFIPPLSPSTKEVIGVFDIGAVIGYLLYNWK